VFLLPAALLLPVELVAVIAIVQNIPEWLRSRPAWYIQSFNIFNYTLATMGAWGAARGVQSLDGLIANTDARFALAGACAAVVFVSLNAALIAPMLRLGRGQPMRMLFSFQHLSTELVFAALGVGVAAFWLWNPWLIPFAIAPLILIHRALSVPQLEAEARVDPKTGLFNARHFANALSEEMVRAGRFERPLSLIMADLDLLRDINNTYGHLAGDAVLKGIADVFRAQLRNYDVPARFGGEEFSILLPETPTDKALEIAERIRRAVAEKRYEVETSSEPIRATISIGVAGFPGDAVDANALIHQADLAVYRAKLQGRNRVLGASSEPLLTPVDRSEPLVAVPENHDDRDALVGVPELPALERRHTTHTVEGPRFVQLSKRLGLLVDRETLHRQNRQMALRMRKAHLRQDAAVEDIDFRHPRSLDRSVVLALANCQWIKNRRNCLITGPTGVGKTYLACALAQKACREGFSARYVRAGRLLGELAAARLDGSYITRLRTLAAVDLLVLDDWGVAPLSDEGRRDLLEILDDRYDRKSTLVTSQVPVDRWHEYLADPTIADAILDRLVHNAHRLALDGESMRRLKADADHGDAGLMRNVTHEREAGDAADA